MPRSNRLTALATEIKAAHEEVVRSSTRSAECVVEAGRRLAEAKAREDIPRGGWERWVEQEAGVPRATADRYIALSLAIEQRLLTIADIAKAGQLGALRLAKGETAPKPAKEKPAAKAAPITPPASVGAATEKITKQAPGFFAKLSEAEIEAFAEAIAALVVADVTPDSLPNLARIYRLIADRLDSPSGKIVDLAAHRQLNEGEAA